MKAPRKDARAPRYLVLVDSELLTTREHTTTVRKYEVLRSAFLVKKSHLSRGTYAGVVARRQISKRSVSVPCVGPKSTLSKIASERNCHSGEKGMPRLTTEAKKKLPSVQAKMLTTVGLRNGTMRLSGPSDRLHWAVVCR